MQESRSNAEESIRVMHPCMIFVSISLIKPEGAGTVGHKSFAAIEKYPTGHQ